MKICIYVKAEELILYKGLFEHLYLLINSVKRKGFDIYLNFYNDGCFDQNDFIITLGQINIDGQNANILLEKNYNSFTENFFDILKNFIFDNAKQYTVKLFGNLEDVNQRLYDIETAYKGTTAIFAYKQGLVTTLKVLCQVQGDAVLGEIYTVFNKNIYADEDITLDGRLLELLTIRNKVISVAESLTGGLICSTIIDNAGASDSFFEGLVTYSNNSKINRLGVDEQTIKKYGAVSYETAYEMSAGLLEKGNCDIAIATTGIAGPSGGTITKPVGLTYIAIGTKERIHVYRHVFGGDRNEIINSVCSAAMFYSIKRLKDNSLDFEEIQIT